MNVYISHSAQSQIGPLKDLLQAEGVSFRDSFDISAGTDVSKSILDEIQAADVVIAVINGKGQNVFFEIGVAVALRKPVLGLLSPGVSVPSFVPPLAYLTSDLADSDVLRLGIRQFVERSREGHTDLSGNRQAPQATHHARTSLRSLIKELPHLRQSGNPAKVERLVEKMFRMAEITAVEAYGDVRDKGVDFAVWSDSLQTSLGNPVLVEVKASKLNEMSFRVAYSRLAKQVQDSSSAAGLLLYLDKNGKRFRRPATWIPTVLWFDIEDFANELLRKDFARVLTERRNKAVHGLVD
jgi:hypothetical protein